MFLDYHTHTNFSTDGKQTVFQLCEAALFRGVSELCLTDHYEPHSPMPEFAVPPSREILTELAKARRVFPQLKIKLGFEVTDNPPHHDEIAEWMNTWELDYFLLSHHTVEGLDPFMPEYFERYNNDRKASYEAYALSVVESLSTWRPREFDCLAHLGYVGRYAPFPEDTRAFSWRDAPDIVDELLRSVIDHEAALEINTASYRAGDQPTPGVDILRRYRELGGEFVMFGSDAHKVEHVAYAFDRAHEAALSCGLKYTYRFHRREREVVNICCQCCRK
ncbi:MAG: histidinol-phosphatase HisJ family protein [Oscillospiraceae bacterium]|jgi:histidinol-phosphatase (PHP family)|nr:histidinol-phosphatase HisJ family protein [Oscillospiraceae bacterium]